MLHSNHHIRHGKAFRLKRRHFNALLVGAACLGSIGAAMAQTASAATVPTVLVVGDSLTAEYGLRRGSGWVALLQQRLDQEKIPARMVNAGISADTTSGGRSRLPALLRQHKPAVVIIELGGNDALRGMPLSMTRDNLAAMARLSRGAGARVLLVGMEVPPNYGTRYTQEFRQVFKTVAQAEKIGLVPFLLAGVADVPDGTATLFQSDRIHPNELAQPTLAGNVWPALRGLLTKR
ncbi:MAG: arylesterase [Gammaproteobacteria bacterium]|nr:arylesterase [Gammaproteobacteria bacterium]MBV1730828.1 arylesterase [Hydrogenophaga sp.]